MTRATIARLLNPWRARRDRTQLRFEALRARDGDDCRRCRRPLRFDLPRGHERAPTLQQIVPHGAERADAAAAGQLANLCLCHARCNQVAGGPQAGAGARTGQRG